MTAVRGNISTIGLVGLGFISEFHARSVGIVAPGASVIGVDVSADARMRAESGGWVSSTLESVHALIEMRPDVVHLLTPPDTHLAIALPLLRAGIDVLAEKPLASTLAACRELRDAAAESGAILGVSHNQLFYRPWERARDMIRDGRIGDIRSVDVVGRHPMGFLRANDTRPWMMRESTNILFEVAPHSFAQVLDVIDCVQVHSVRTGSVQRLANGVDFFRQWDILASSGEIAVHVSLSFDDAFGQSTVSVRGTLGDLVVDFDRNTVETRVRSFAPFDLEGFEQATTSAISLTRGAISTLAGVVASKAGLRRFSDPYGGSITESIRCFYQSRSSRLVDPRQSGAFGTAVVELAEAVAAASNLAAQPAASAVAQPLTSVGHSAKITRTPRVLVIGGTGFIGSPLVRVISKDEPVRVVARNVDAARVKFSGLDVEVVRGDMRDPDAIFDHIDPGMVVYHLAFGGGGTWDELQATDVVPTIRLAELCATRGIERFIYTSSIAIYDAGKATGTVNEQTAASKGLLRVAPYPRSKAAVEDRLFEMWRSTGFPVVVARPGIVLGEESDPIHWGVASWRHSNVCIHWGSGRNPLPIVLVEDVAVAMASLRSAAEVVGESFNLCAPASITAEDYLAELSRVSGPILRRANPALRLYTSSIAKWLLKLPGASRVPFPSYADCAGRSFAATFDCSKAERMLGWSPVADRNELLNRGVSVPARAWTR